MMPATRRAAVHLLLALGLLCPAVLRSAPPPAAAQPPVTVGPADEAADETPEEESGLAALLGKMKPQQGDITLGSDLAKLHVPEGFQFFGPDDTVNFLVHLGNPRPKRAPLGMILPGAGGKGPGWFAVLQYEEDGYVSDKDADTLDYNKILKEMQEGAREDSKQRVAQGLQGLELVGWAEPPRYDKNTKKLYWAKDIRFTGENDHTLNYSIRMLGRRGVLVLNCVASLEQIQEIQGATPQLLGMVEFNQGHRYVDFDPKTDKTAAYGLAALVAGGIAAKAGLFKGLLVAVLAAKKFVVIGAIALFGLVKKLFNRGGNTSDGKA